MENKSCKDRSTNFSPEEINKLRELLERYPIILNKKTDHASSKQKDDAWCKLATEFNSNNSTYRSKKQLIYKFNNMKKTARKELSCEKRERRFTGGGPPPPKPSDTSEWLCNIMKQAEAIEELHKNAEVNNLGDLQFYMANDTPRPDPMCDQVTVIGIQEIQDSNKPEERQPVSTKTEIPSLVLTAAQVSAIDILEKQETCFDTSTPRSMLKKPVSAALETGNRKRKLLCTPAETRRRIISVTNKKEQLIKEKRSRETIILKFAEEEHMKKMEHLQTMHDMEIDFKKKINELFLKKAALEVEIEEEKLKKLKFENKDLL